MKRPRIEAIPKRVVIVRTSDGRFVTRPGIDLPQFLDAILDVRAHIEAGRELPRHYYRKSLGRDYLLETRGWLHLHVGYGIDDNVLLIVEETEDTVVFIGLTNHDIFRERPRGKSLAGLGSRIARAKLTRSVPPPAPVKKP